MVEETVWCSVGFSEEEDEEEEEDGEEDEEEEENAFVQERVGNVG